MYLFEKTFQSPYSALTSYLRDLFEAGYFKKERDLIVPSWLTPAPNLKELALLTPANNVSFIDSNGCWKYAERVRQFVNESIADGLPAMIAVNHSMAGGVLRALARRYTSENIRLFKNPRSREPSLS